jgi:hypothetical protein
MGWPALVRVAGYECPGLCRGSVANPVVQRAEPEGVDIKSTKSGKSRRVPIPDRVLPLVRAMAVDRDADARLFVTDSGHQLHATAFKRTLGLDHYCRGPTHSRPAAHGRVLVASARS